MSRTELIEKRRHLRKENAKYGSWDFVTIPQHDWPQHLPPTIVKVLRSREFLVQVHQENKAGATFRLSICRTELDDDGEYRGGITWDELRRIKAGCGFAHYDAVEIYPMEIDVVNVANMRHLWVVERGFIKFAWRKSPLT